MRLIIPEAPAACGRRDQDFLSSARAVSAGGGWSPMTVLRGQTLNAGHLAQPTARATGQSVMAGLVE